MKRQSASRAACQTAFGSLCHSSRAVRPAAITTRAARAKPPDRAALVVFCCRVLLPVSIVGICTGIVAVIIAGPWALAYVPLYVLATLPGWPLGRVLFGRHPASWVFGALAGYGLTCLAFWMVIAAGIPSAITFVLAWASCRQRRDARGCACRARAAAKAGRLSSCHRGPRTTLASSFSSCCWFPPSSCSRTRTSGRRTPTAIASIAPISQPTSSGTRR